MSAHAPRRRPTRAEILETLARVGRENSDATVIFHATMARGLGLHPTDYKTLGLLERLGPLSAGEIAERTGLATASVTNLIDRLEAKGFVRRVRDAADRRRVIIEPVAGRLGAGGGASHRPARPWRDCSRPIRAKSCPSLRTFSPATPRG